MRAGPAGPRPFLIESAHARAEGTERDGVSRISVGGRAVVASLDADLGPGANVLVSPASLRRERLGRLGSVEERVLCAPALPLVALQWRTPSADTFGITFTVLPDVAEVRYDLADSVLRVWEATRPDTVVDVALDSRLERWNIEAGERGGLRVRVEVDSGNDDGRPESTVTFLVAAGAPAAAERALAAAPHLSAHEVRANADADPDRADTLTVRSGVAALDHGVLWATLRLRAALARAPSEPARADAEATPAALFWCGVGATAIGDAETALRALAGIPRDDPLGTLLAASLTLQSGDPRPALDRLNHLTRDAVEHVRLASDRGAWGTWRFALETLADALRSAAPDATVTDLREAAARPAGDAGGRRLPMAGDAPAPEPVTSLRTLLGVGLPPSRSGHPPIGSDVLPDALGGWWRTATGDPDGGYAAWRRLLDEGLAGGPVGRGSWDAGPAAPTTGVLLATLAHGMLGLGYDAPSGLVRIAPHLPAHMRSITVERIPVGDVRLTLTYEREGALHRFVVTPTAGAAPATAVFAPSITGGTPGTVRVDGVVADLAVDDLEGRSRPRVRLALDGPRVVEIENG